LIVLSLIDGKTNVRETEAVEQFARALQVDATEARDLINGLPTGCPSDGCKPGVSLE
jgi:hypothetical protein